MQPRYPIYIPSKGRHDSRLTVKALERMGVAYHIVVEPQEFDAYAKVIDESKILVLPFSNRGLIPSLNWIWEHSIERGFARHWALDDNIRVFKRTANGYRVPVYDGSPFCAIEDYVDRFSNVRLAGMQYSMFCTNKVVRAKPYLLNGRVYSCLLVDNSMRFRWRRFYNADTDMNLRILKSGDCTMVFYALSADKMRTMTVKGGLTDHYQKKGEVDGRLEMAKSLVQQHPDCVKIVWKWGRWQHKVDYRKFRGNKLKLRPGATWPEDVNNYGMVLVDTNTMKPVEVLRAR